MITIIGSLNYDLVTYTAVIPESGETIQSNSFEKHLGGKGLNEALACARLRKTEKTNVRMVGKVGSDSFGLELKQALLDASVDMSHVATIEGESSGVATILVEESGENRILIVAGANGQLKPTAAEYERIFPAPETESHYVILQNEYPHTIQSILWLKKERPHINIAYNPSPFKAELITEENLRNIDLLIVNEVEALEIVKEVFKDVGSHDVKETEEFFGKVAKSLQRLICQTSTSAVIITLGSKGTVFAEKGKADPYFEPSAKVNHVVDTTGAGDTFLGGVVLQLSGGKTLKCAVKFATVASSLAIQKRGAAESIPFYKDVELAVKDSA